MATNSPLAAFQAVFQSSRFVTFAIVAMNIGYGQALSGETLDAVARHLLRFIGGIVQDLHIEKLRWVIEARDGLDETLDHVALVVNGQLNGDARPLR